MPVPPLVSDRLAFLRSMERMDWEWSSSARRVRSSVSSSLMVGEEDSNVSDEDVDGAAKEDGGWGSSLSRG